MIYTILLIWIAVSIVTVVVLIRTKKIVKGSKGYKKAMVIFLLVPFVMLEAYYLYDHTQTFIDFIISILCACAIFGGMGLFQILVKKIKWLEYMLAPVIIMIYGLIVVLNHFMLDGIERTVIITFGCLLIIDLYRFVEKHMQFKLGLAILAIIMCMIIDYNIRDSLKLDTKIARTVIAFAIEEGIAANSNDVDIIVYESNKGESNPVLLFYDRTSERGFENTTRFIYFDGEVRVKND